MNKTTINNREQLPPYYAGSYDGMSLYHHHIVLNAVLFMYTVKTFYQF